MSSEWSNLYVLRPFSDPQHEEDILRGFGVRKTCQHMTGQVFSVFNLRNYLKKFDKEENLPCTFIKDGKTKKGKKGSL